MHWWCRAPDGKIWDPTISQFPAFFGEYELATEENTPVGKCIECGEFVYKNPAKRTHFCSARHELRYLRDELGQEHVSQALVDEAAAEARAELADEDDS